MKPVYLDYAATTPVAPQVVECMTACLGIDGNFGNPASRAHRYGWLAEEAVEAARRQVADLVGADPREIVWTSGATEANNLAIKGAALALERRGRHLVTAAIEHKAVLDPCRWLEGRGFEVTRLPPLADGSVSPDAVADALREDTVLVSVMHANNETGVINDIGAIGGHCRERGILFHVDAAQTAGKLPLDLGRLAVDLMSFSAHKVYGPKGVGALYLRRAPEVRIEAQMHGGGHERGMRSGTLPTHQLVGMGEAFALAGELMHPDADRIAGLRDRLWQGLEPLGGVHRHGNPDRCLPGHLNLGFEGVGGETLLTALSAVAVSSGSACTSASVEPSHVLRAMGVPDALALASLRFSLGRGTRAEDIDAVIDHVVHVVRTLRRA